MHTTACTEYWKPIPGYEGKYEVSNIGRVRSLHSSTKLLKTPIGSHGYRWLNLSKGGTRNIQCVHRLVMLAFVGPPNNQTVNHKNGNKTDNRLENLEYCSNSDNVKHAFATGLVDTKGERNGMASFTNAQVKEIKQLLAKGVSQAEIVRVYNSSSATISRISTGKVWRHVQAN